MRVTITQQAAGRLEELGAFIAEDNPARAASFVLELLERGSGLAQQSERYPIATSWRGREVRRCPYGNYLIFYVILEDCLEIEHIVHGRRDYVSLLFPDN